MKLSEYLKSERGRALTLAEAIGVSKSRLSQIADDSSSLRPAMCVAIWRATDGAVMRWDLRPADWHEIWPELIGIEGAPSVPTPEPATTEGV